jgi:hypothetical protein
MENFLFFLWISVMFFLVFRVVMAWRQLQKSLKEKE